MTGRRGRPPVGPIVKVRFPPDLLAAVDAECERRDVTRSELLRCIVAAAVGTPNHKSSGAGA